MAFGHAQAGVAVSNPAWCIRSSVLSCDGGLEVG